MYLDFSTNQHLLCMHQHVICTCWQHHQCRSWHIWQISSFPQNLPCQSSVCSLLVDEPLSEWQWCRYLKIAPCMYPMFLRIQNMVIIFLTSVHLVRSVHDWYGWYNCNIFRRQLYQSCIAGTNFIVKCELSQILTVHSWLNIMF